MNHTHERWEYMTQERLNDRELERLGKEGWELVTVAVPSDVSQWHRFYFKRPVPPGAKSEMEKAAEIREAQWKKVGP